MQRTFCLLNHKLTEGQIKELSDKYNSTHIQYPPDNVKSLWRNLPTDKKLSRQTLSVITEWLIDANKNDIIILQGEAGYSFALVDYALKRQLLPLHSVTKRVAKEIYEGEKVHRTYVFEHICFRPYEYWDSIKI
ncbi:MAG: CRISPR-associated protein Csx20 [Treponemataceae bacterium]